MVPSGRGCSEPTSHRSLASLLHFAVDVAPASQRPPTSSNTTSVAGNCPPVDAVATHPPALHTDRRRQASLYAGGAPPIGFPAISSCGPKSAVKVPVNGPVLGTAVLVLLLGVVMAGDEPPWLDTTIAATTISTAITLTAPPMIAARFLENFLGAVCPAPWGAWPHRLGSVSGRCWVGADGDTPPVPHC